jgi:hypothetical protein
MKTKLKAKEILDYCISYLSNFDGLETKQFQKKKRYKDMIKEIEFMINTD